MASPESLAALRDALLANDHARADALQAAEAVDLDQADNAGRTLLHMAVNHMNLGMVQWLVDHGADPTHRLKRESALTMAVRSGASRILDVFLQAGADPDGVDADGMTPLMRALQHATKADLMAERLLNAGANPNLRSRDGATALLIALNENRRELLGLLAAHGADPNLANHEGLTAAHVAAKSHRVALLEAFLATFPGVDLNRQTKSGILPLSHVHATKIAKILIEAGANPAIRSVNPFYNGVTPLMVLARGDQDGDTLALAIARGAPVDQMDTEGTTVLGHAIQGKNLRAIQTLYQRGLPLNSPADRKGLSPYHLVLQANPAEKVHVALGLKRLGVPVDLPPTAVHEDLPMASPLTHAFRTNDLVAAAVLLTADAAINQPGPNRQAPAHGLVLQDVSWTQQRRTAVGTLAQVAKIRATPDPDKPLTDKELDHLTKQEGAAQNVLADVIAQSHDAIGLILGAGVDWSVPDGKGRTALQLAAEKGAAQLAAVMLDAGMDPHAPNAQGDDAFTIALHHGQTLTLHTLIEKAQRLGQPWIPSLDALVLATPGQYPQRGRFIQTLRTLAALPEAPARINQADEEGNTALILAAATAQDDLVEVLLGLGADARATNAQGETALMQAVGQQQTLAIVALLDHGADPDACSQAGLTARTIAGSDRDFLAILDEPRQTPTPLVLEAQAGHDIRLAQAIAQQAPSPPVDLNGWLDAHLAPESLGDGSGEGELDALLKSLGATDDGLLKAQRQGTQIIGVAPGDNLAITAGTPGKGTLRRNRP